MTRRAFAAAVGAAWSCGREKQPVGYRGFALIANSAGGAVAAVDLTALALIKHIPLGADPSDVIADPRTGQTLALTPATGTLHEIDSSRLVVARKVVLPAPASLVRFAPGGDAIWVLCREQRLALRLSADLKVQERIALPGIPADLAFAPPDRETAGTVAISVREPGGVVLIRKQGTRFAEVARDPGQVLFRKDGRHLIAAGLDARELVIFDAMQDRVAVRLPLAVRPDRICPNEDGGQLFVTGDGADAVVTVYPFWTEVGNYMLAGRAPGALAVAGDTLFIANPQSGDVSIIDIQNQKLMGQAQVGREPHHIAITPDRQFACVLNRLSGDMAVLHIPTLTARRNKKASLLTMIPVGSGPVSAVVRPA
ncbi:MAG: hypothetical protein FJW39_31310 [Acidobacteria bacterium]|nr:hypothetical protein [Acidobacteriota bacterium]